MTLHHTHNTPRLNAIIATLRHTNSPDRGHFLPTVWCLQRRAAASCSRERSGECEVLPPRDSAADNTAKTPRYHTQAPLFFIASTAAMPTLWPKAPCGAASTAPTLFQKFHISFVQTSVLLVRSRLFQHSFQRCPLASVDGWERACSLGACDTVSRVCRMWADNISLCFSLLWTLVLSFGLPRTDLNCLTLLAGDELLG